MVISSLSPSALFSFLVQILLWEILNYVSYCVILQSVCLSCTLNRFFAHAWYCAIVCWPCVIYMDFQMLMCVFKQYRNVTFVNVPTDLKNLKYSEALGGGYKFSKIQFPTKAQMLSLTALEGTGFLHSFLRKGPPDTQNGSSSAVLLGKHGGVFGKSARSFPAAQRLLLETPRALGRSPSPFTPCLAVGADASPARLRGTA